MFDWFSFFVVVLWIFLFVCFCIFGFFIVCLAFYLLSFPFLVFVILCLFLCYLLCLFSLPFCSSLGFCFYSFGFEVF